MKKFRFVKILVIPAIVFFVSFMGWGLHSYAKDNSQSIKELWEKAAVLSNTADLKPVDINSGVIQPHNTKPFKKAGEGSTYIYVSSGLTSSTTIQPYGYAISQIKAVGKTKSTVLISTHGVTTTFMLNGSLLGTKKDTGVGKTTDTATITIHPGNVQPGWDYRATSHHTETTATATYVVDTADRIVF